MKKRLDDPGHGARTMLESQVARHRHLALLADADVVLRADLAADGRGRTIIRGV